MPLSCKQMGHAWGISPTKTSQVRNHVMRKVALLLLLYPDQTFEEIAEWLPKARRELLERDEGEIQLREHMLNGRL